MTPIEELAARVGQQAQNGESGPVPLPGDSPAGAAGAALDQALRFSGLDGAEVGALVLIGADGGALELAARRFPSLAGVLVVEPDLRRLRSLAALGGQDDPPAWKRVCWVADLADPDSPVFALGLYLELAQFFDNLAIAPGRALVVGDFPGGVSSIHARALGPVKDFCSGLSASFFANVYHPARVTPLVLRALGDLLLEVGEPYHALKFYWLLYHTLPGLEVGLRVLQCWAELDCPVEVERFLAEPCFEAQAELSITLRGQLADQRAQQAADRQVMFARNLAALADANPARAAELESVTPADFACAVLPSVPWRLRYDGQGVAVERDRYPLLVQVAGDRLREINPPPEPAAIDQALSRAEQAHQAHACVGRLVGNAGAAENLLTSTVTAPMPGWRRVCYLVEPDPSALAALLRVMDLSDSLLRECVQVFCGPAAEAELIGFLRNDPNLAVPFVRLGVAPELATALDGVERERAEQVRVAFERLTAGYRPERTGEIREVIEGRLRRPLRVLFVSSLYTSMIRHVVQDLAAAFEASGHSTCIVQEDRPGQQLHHQTLTSRLLAFSPDFVVMINHTRPAVPSAFPPGLPVITWIQDELPLLKEPAHIRTLGTLDLTYAFSTAVAAIHRALGYPHVGHLPFAVNPACLKGEIPVRCRDEVAFVTRLPNLPDLVHAPGFKAWLARRLASERTIPVNVRDLEPLLGPASADLGYPFAPENRHELLMSALMVARELDRIRVADTLLEAGLPLALYGEGWEALPRFRPHFRGVVAPGEPLWQVFRESKVVLHINRGCNIHPRLLEGFAAGGFVLASHDSTDDQPGETVDQFAVGRELVLFHSDEEMVATIRRAMTDEPWRQSIISAARKRIESHHTYRSRIPVILEDLSAQVATYLRQEARAA